jgi:signal transduction histidine kinase
VILVAVLLAAVGTAWRAIATVRELDDRALQGQADLIIAALPPALDANGVIHLPDALVNHFRASDGDNVFLVFADGRLLGTSDAPVASEMAPFLRESTSDGFFRVPRFVNHSRGMIGFVTRAGPFRIAVLQGREQTAALLDSLIGNFLLGALWLLLPLGAALILVSVATVRLGLGPVRRVSTAAAKIGPGHPDIRLPTEALPSEIAPLVHAMNDALERLQEAIALQRRFVAEAAHALRTPLAVLTARLDMVEGHPELAPLRHDADRMARLVSQMLRMVRLESLPVDVSKTVELRAVAAEAIADLAPLGLRRGVEIALDAPLSGAAVIGNHAALSLALTNLIENALMHAPAGTTVEVVITPRGMITVRDRGPGVPEPDRARIFGRFERGGAARYGGAGLGLAIVGEIAAMHGGSVTVNDRPGGGAAFTLTVAGAAAHAQAAAETSNRPASVGR